MDFFASTVSAIIGAVATLLAVFLAYKLNQQQQVIYTHDTEFYTLWPPQKRSSQIYEKSLQEHQQAQKDRKNSLKEIAEAVDNERNEIIETLNKIWKTLKIEPMTKPTEVKDY